MERGAKQCERIIEWLTPQVNRKIMISDAKVPLSWLRNKTLRTQPFIQTRIHNICKIFEPSEAYYIPSKKNPSDLSTKFDKFNDAYLLLDENSLFRNGPECLKKGIEAAVESKELPPLNKLTLDDDDKIIVGELFILFLLSV